MPGDEADNREKAPQTRPDLDELEAVETADWVADCERREYRKSEAYLQRKKLAERFAIKGKKK